MRSFLLSALKKKFESTPLASFVEAHPHDWLVWEPGGGWNPPAKVTLAGTMKAAVASSKSGTLSGEALAVALEPRKDGVPVVVGRSDCDFVVNDGTVSLRHLQFNYDGFRWTVGDLASRNGSQLDGIKLGEKAEPLFNGAELTMGSVQLTYYVPSGMHERLWAKTPR